jgi:hypothetical protein
MASLITPTSINATYPVAGVDNDSQGFRDNFSAIRSNFTQTKSEIEDLQSSTAKVTDNNDFNGNKIQDAQLQQVYETAVNLGTVGGATTINFASGGYQYCTTSSSITLSFSNFPTSGKFAKLLLEVNLTSGHTITCVARKPSGFTMPTATGTHLLEISTRDGGSTLFLRVIGNTYATAA